MFETVVPPQIQNNPTKIVLQAVAEIKGAWTATNTVRPSMIVQ